MQELIEEARADFPEPELLPGQKITIDHPEQVYIYKFVCWFGVLVDCAVLLVWVCQWN